MAGTPRYWDMNVTGAADFLNRMKRFDADSFKIIDREMKDALKVVAEDARSRVPSDGLSGWGKWIAAKDGRDLSYSSGSVSSGIKPRNTIRTRKGQATSWRAQVVQTSAAGAIFSLAGSKNDSGSNFNTNINNKRGSGSPNSGFWPRVLTPAYYAKGPEAGDRIEAALQQAMNQV